jgi:DNA-binding NarL/FixJ family response regulator
MINRMMSNIQLAIYDDHRIVQEGICSLLKDVDDIDIVLKSDKPEQLQESLKSIQIHILILNIHVYHEQYINLIKLVNLCNPKINILIISVINDENVILKTIKAGAKGFLAKDTDRNELIEAIYTLRNGFDYFSNSITHILLNRYIKKLKTNDEKDRINSLSSREIEIMKMWGNSYTNKEIAEKLFLSVRTVETHKNHIMQKLNLKTSVDMVKFAIKNNLIDL